MAVSKRDQVEAMHDLYAEGGTLASARKTVGLRWADYYRELESTPELKAQFAFIRKCRGHMHADEAYERLTDVTDTKTETSRLRATVDGLLKLASVHNKEDYGDKLELTHELGPSLLPMLEARKQRALQPLCDLETVIDVESEAIPSLSDQRSTDTQSDAPVVGDVDPFEP